LIDAKGTIKVALEAILERRQIPRHNEPVHNGLFSGSICHLPKPHGKMMHSSGKSFQPFILEDKDPKEGGIVRKKSPASVRMKRKQNKSRLGERRDAVHLHLNGDFVYRSVFYCFLFQTVCSNFYVLRVRDSG
jgi:hypothetical protein